MWPIATPVVAWFVCMSNLSVLSETLVSPAEMAEPIVVLVQLLSQKIWQNISLCGEIMKLGTLVGDPCGIIFRLGPNSEAPPGGRHLEF